MNKIEDPFILKKFIINSRFGNKPVSKKCTKFNYIPHIVNIGKSKYRQDIHFDKWFDEYENQIKIMFYDTIETIKQRLDEDLEFDYEEIFELFTNLIYDSSSKYILKDI
jgi:hypothetical protein